MSLVNLLKKPLARANLGKAISLISQAMQQKIPYSEGAKLPEKLRRAQKLFQEKNNLPVFLKGGSTDKILYYTTVSLAGLGLFSSLVLFAGYIID